MIYLDPGFFWAGEVGRFLWYRRGEFPIWPVSSAMIRSLFRARLRVRIGRRDVEQRLVEADLDGHVAVATTVHDEGRIPLRRTTFRATAPDPNRRAGDGEQQYKARDRRENADLYRRPQVLAITRHAGARGRQVKSGRAGVTFVRFGASAASARRVTRSADQSRFPSGPLRIICDKIATGTFVDARSIPLKLMRPTNRYPRFIWKKNEIYKYIS